MSILVITVIGTDRAGLVSALAGVVADHEGNWTRSQLAELAGAFAGIVVVEVPDARVAAFTAAALAIDGLEVVVQGGQEAATPTARQVTLEVLGNDRPGIVKEISRVVARHGLSILELPTDTREAPMTGGRLFEARLTVEVDDPSDLDAVRADLERIAAELMVDLSWGEA
ncbi:MAG TPA: ACT domain-containing protein [Propioniciclava sp.]|uniref:glycine cleavage system protein R n=1 Tax=Propioniciclava sp. TaxID=2038686 RepID=UPI002B996B3E|nr:ACT domain-containing protein [Propioniciclava sp.]HRL49755.1 ACT domain-containing protein [Propioniciclava sp.]HRL79866.1 ACT domain-containing protein [Propioniciclava sp.]